MQSIPNPRLASSRDILVWAQTADRTALIAWLKWNDPNGDYSDDSPTSAEYGPLTIDEARAYVAEHVAEGRDPR